MCRDGDRVGREERETRRGQSWCEGKRVRRSESWLSFGSASSPHHLKVSSHSHTLTTHLPAAPSHPPLEIRRACDPSQQSLNHPDNLASTQRCRLADAPRGSRRGQGANGGSGRQSEDEGKAGEERVGQGRTVDGGSNSRPRTAPARVCAAPRGVQRGYGSSQMALGTLRAVKADLCSSSHFELSSDSIQLSPSSAP